jgi:hypothetical protein
MEHHGEREHALMNGGPPGPVCRADLAIRRDGDGVPEIAGEEGRHVHGGITRSARPHLLDHVRTLVDTLPHELVADPAIVALRHVVLGCVCVCVLNMKVGVFHNITSFNNLFIQTHHVSHFAHTFQLQ